MCRFMNLFVRTSALTIFIFVFPMHGISIDCSEIQFSSLNRYAMVVTRAQFSVWLILCAFYITLSRSQCLKYNIYSKLFGFDSIANGKQGISTEAEQTEYLKCHDSLPKNKELAKQHKAEAKSQFRIPKNAEVKFYIGHKSRNMECLRDPNTNTHSCGENGPNTQEIPFSRLDDIKEYDIIKGMSKESQFRLLVHGFIDSYNSIYLINKKCNWCSIYYLK